MTDNLIVKKVIEEIEYIKLKDRQDYVMEAAQLKTINKMRLENINEVLSTGKTFQTTKELIDNKTFLAWRKN